MVELLHLPFSPWSEKARWALELSGVPFTKREYVPVLGELELRRLQKRWRGKVTVPVLIDGGRVLGDSYEIARFASERGTRSLFPAGREERVRQFNALSERGLDAGRALALRRALDRDGALLENLPKPLRKGGPLALAFARWAVGRTLRKYDGHIHEPEVYERTLCEVLDQLRAALAQAAGDSEPKTLLGELSYADLAMAQVLIAVRPHRGARLGRHTREVFSHPGLADRYPDLLQWRDALYERYGKASAR